MNASRRGLLVGLGASLIAAPAIVRISSLMPVKLFADDGIAMQSISHPTDWPGIETWWSRHYSEYSDRYVSSDSATEIIELTDEQLKNCKFRLLRADLSRAA